MVKDVVGLNYDKRRNSRGGFAGLFLGEYGIVWS
jgi:hypothetical protein